MENETNQISGLVADNGHLKINQVYNEDPSYGMLYLPEGNLYCIVTAPIFHPDTNSSEREDAFFEWIEEVTRGYKIAIIDTPVNQYKFSFQAGMFPDRVATWITNKKHLDIVYYGLNGELACDWIHVDIMIDGIDDPMNARANVVSTIARIISQTIPPSYTIIDPYMGTGVVIEACKMAGYTSVGFEEDEKIFKIAKTMLNKE